MDKTDYKILEILQSNGRISMKKLSEEVNMSTPAVIERVRKLEENKSIIGYRASIRPDRIGREINAFMLVTVEWTKRRAFYEYVKNSDNVIDAYEIAGRFTVLLNISCCDMEEFLKTIYELYDLGTTETYMITDVIKNGFYKQIIAEDTVER